MANIRSQDGSITLTNVPDSFTGEQKQTLINVMRSRTGGFTGSYQDALQAMQGAPPEAISRLDAPLPQAFPGGVPEQIPETTVGGILGAVAREGGPQAIGALGGGAVGGPAGALAGGAITEHVVNAMDSAIPVINEIFGTDYSTASESWNQIMTDFGVEEPDTFVEELAADITSGGAAAVGTLGLGKILKMLSSAKAGLAPTTLSRTGEVLAAQPAAEIAGSIGAEVAPTIAEEAGAGQLGQMGAAVGGALAGGTIGAKLDDAVRALMTKTPLTTAQREVLEEAARAGVTIRRSDILPPTTRAGKATQEILEGIPFGTGAQRLEQNQQRIDAVKDIMRQYGAGDAGYAAEDIAQDLLTKWGDDLTTWHGNKVEVLEQFADATDVVNTEKTVGLINDLRAELLGPLKYEANHPLIKKLSDWEQRIQDNPLVSLEEIRSDFGEELMDDAFKTVRTRAQKYYNQIYDSLRNDMGDYIEANSDAATRNKWMTANTNISNMIKEESSGVLAKALNSAEQTPEEVTRLLFNQNRSSIRKLYENLTPAGREKARGAIVADWVEQATDQGVISPNKFSKLVADDLTSETGTRRFTPFFSSEDRGVLQGLQRVFDTTTEAERAVRKSAIPGGLPTAIVPGAGYAAARALGQDPVLGLAVGTSALFSIGQVAKFMESPRIRNLALRLANTPRNSAREMEAVKRLLDVVRTEEPVETTMGLGAGIEERAQGRSRAIMEGK